MLLIKKKKKSSSIRHKTPLDPHSKQFGQHEIFKLFQEVRFLYGNKPSLRVITGREPVLGATPALIGLALWHRCSEVRTDIPAFGVASVSLNSALADLQSGSGRASLCVMPAQAGETTCRSDRGHQALAKGWLARHCGSPTSPDSTNLRRPHPPHPNLEPSEGYTNADQCYSHCRHRRLLCK